MSTHQEENWQALFERMFAATKHTQSNLETMARELAAISSSYQVAPKETSKEELALLVQDLTACEATMKQLALRLDTLENQTVTSNNREPSVPSVDENTGSPKKRNRSAAEKKPNKLRVTHSPEQKEEALKRHAAGDQIADIARDLNVNYKTVFSWINKNRPKAPETSEAETPVTDLPPTPDAE